MFPSLLIIHTIYIIITSNTKISIWTATLIIHLCFSQSVCSRITLHFEVISLGWAGIPCWAFSTFLLAPLAVWSIGTNCHCIAIRFAALVARRTGSTWLWGMRETRTIGKGECHRISVVTVTKLWWYCNYLLITNNLTNNNKHN